MVGPRRGISKPKTFVRARKIIKSTTLAKTPDGKAEVRIVQLPNGQYRWEARIRGVFLDKPKEWRIARVSLPLDDKERIIDGAHAAFGSSNLRFL